MVASSTMSASEDSTLEYTFWSNDCLVLEFDSPLAKDDRPILLVAVPLKVLLNLALRLCFTYLLGGVKRTITVDKALQPSPFHCWRSFGRQSGCRLSVQTVRRTVRPFSEPAVDVELCSSLSTKNMGRNSHIWLGCAAFGRLLLALSNRWHAADCALCRRRTNQR